MTPHSLAQTAYAANKTPIRTARGTEYDAFAQITHRLRTAEARGRSGFSDLASALHANRRLWTMLAADVAEDGNALPQNLRAQIFYLAEFTTQHSRKVLRGDDTAGALIDINTAIMRGLRATGAAA